MTQNGLIDKATQISWMPISGDIPVTMNGEPIEIYDITLEGSNGNYHADIKAIARIEDTLRCKAGIPFPSGRE